MRTPEDLRGRKYGDWLVTGIERVNRKSIWKCVCSCGTERLIFRGNLTLGRTTNCGCKQREKCSVRMSTHGESKTKLYGVWCAMRRRCYLETTADYKNYGARGITVCEDWRSDFEAFKHWALMNGYEEGLTIERLNVDLNYTPDNCSWVTRTVQNRNRRNTRNITIDGVTKPLPQWAEEYGINKGTLESRMVRGWSGKELLIKSLGRGSNGSTARTGGIENV